MADYVKKLFIVFLDFLLFLCFWDMLFLYRGPVSASLDAQHYVVFPGAE